MKPVLSVKIHFNNSQNNNTKKHFLKPNFHEKVRSKISKTDNKTRVHSPFLLDLIINCRSKRETENQSEREREWR